MATPSRVAQESSKALDPPIVHYENSDCESSQCSSKRSSKHDDELSTHGQYLDVLVRLQRLVKDTIPWREENCHHQETSSTKNDIHSSLDTALIDIHVWMNDLSGDAAKFLESIESLKNHNHELNARLQRRVARIRQILTSVDEEVNDKILNLKTSDFEPMLQNCRKICVLVDQLKSLKPDLMNEFSAWPSIKHILPTDDISLSQHAIVLCFDGGGVRSYASLLILKKLMEYIDRETGQQLNTSSQDVLKKPCDVFNFMYGSSSGGLIAIMLGRLEMTVEDCIQRFSAYADTLFSHPRLVSRLAMTSKYSEKTLIKATRLIVGEFDPTPNSEGWRRNIFGVPDRNCKIGVLATVISRTVPRPHMFRTYDCIIPKPETYSPKRMPSNPGPASDLQIWEVVRATSAAPLFFPEVEVQNQVFVDGGLMTNNPCQEALRDIAFLHQDKLKDICLVSIGSGTFRGQHLSTPVSGRKQTIGDWKNIVRLFRSVVTETQTTDKDVHELSLDHGFPYFRFDPDLDRDISLDEWIKPRSSGHQSGTLRDIDRLIDNYLETEDVKTRLHDCASAIVLYKLRANSGGFESHYFIPFERNRHFVGRSSELHQLETILFKYNRYQKIAIYGLGGVGKTQIALEFAYRTMEKHPACSIFWIQASNVENFEQVYLQIGMALGIPGLNDEKADVKQLVKSELSKESAGQWLLILDNADDADIWFQPPNRSSQATALMDYLPKSSKGSVIFTTRDRKVALKMAPTKGVMEIRNMDESVAIDLFESSLIKSTATEEMEARRKLLTLLTYLPLAIVQAAAYINANDISVSEYLSLAEDTEDNVVEILSEGFEDDRRYTDSKNAVATTWLISFEQIRRHDSLATDYLCFMSCLDTHMVPQSLLPPAQPMKRAVDAIGTLLAHSFITKNENDMSFNLHPLIHLATRSWLKQENTLEEWTAKTVARLVDVLPASDYRNIYLWADCLPHANYVLKSRYLKKSSEETWELFRKVGLFLLTKGLYYEAEDPLAQTAELSSITLGEEHPYTLTSMANLASTYRNQGRWNEAEKLGVQVIETRKRVLGEEHPDTLTSMANLASTYRNQGRWNEAEKLGVQVIEIRKRVLGEKHLDTLTSMANLASTYRNQGRWNEAEKLGVQVIETRKRVLGEEHPETLTSMANLALTYRIQGHWYKAEKLGVQVMEANLRMLGKEHPSTLSSIENLASTYQNQGRWSEAEKLGVQVIEGSLKMLGEEHPDTLASMANLALTYQNQGRWNEAEKLEVQVIETRRRVLGEEHPGTLTSIGNLAATYRNQGRWDEAEKLGVQVIEGSLKMLGKEHPDTLASMANLASIYWSQGRWNEAEKLDVQVLEIRARVLGEEHPSTLSSMKDLAFTMKSQGRDEDAVTLMEQCVNLQKMVLGVEHPDIEISLATLKEWQSVAISV